MRVVVVGASGNVGTAILRRLRAEPAVEEIRGIARRPPPLGSGEPYDDVTWTACDVGRSTVGPRLADSFAGTDAVIHLAWQLQPSHEPALLRRTNIEGTQHVVDAAVRAEVPTLVYASSMGAYAPGPKDRLVAERWPTTGVPGSSYSEDKAAVESMLDRAEEGRPGLRIVRLRPALTFQRDAGAQIARYFLGPLVPTSLLRFGRLPVVPWSARLRVQAVHADDVADAYVRAVFADVTGPFNLAAAPVLDTDLVASHLHGRTVPVSTQLLRQAASLTWRARLQPVEPGWVALARSAPLMDCARAHAELGWKPRYDAVAALRELIAGIAAGAGTGSPALRPREALPERLGRRRSSGRSAFAG